MVNNMLIIKASDEHIKSIAHIERECFSTPWSEDSIKDAIRNDNNYTVIFFENGVVKGYAGMYHVCSEGYINNIAVLPEYRGNKIGTMLLKNLINYSNYNKLEFLSLEVRKSNLIAIKIYKNFGFDIVGKRKNFYSNPFEDAVIMTKWLNKK